MLYHLREYLIEFSNAFNVFGYITFRSFAALMTALFIYLAFGKKWIRFLQKKQMEQAIREDSPAGHVEKKGTPTMGGVLIIISVAIAMFLWGNWTNPFVWACLYLFLGMGAIGFYDDYRKVIKKDPHGFPGRYKIILEVFLCLSVGIWLFAICDLETKLYLPFFKNVQFDLGFGYLIFAILVIVGTANAVNLTDGLDGLAAVPSMTSFMAYAFFIYVAGNTILSGYLQLPHVSFAGEITVVCTAMVGALIGFLWFNTYPAQIFMGDVGSLSIGGLLGLVAMIAKQEILLILIGGLFVLETVSVITQVASFKLTGKRIFRMAPLHHHFELKGWAEPKVIVRFWIISIILALMALTTLKLR